MARFKENDWSEKNIPNQKGKVIIITGASSGIGKAGAEILAGKEAQVILAVRNIQKGQKVVDEIKSRNPKALLEVRKLDLSSLDSVKNFADGFKKNYQQLDILINNAGIMACPFDTTKDGFEIQMGTNHLGHFALTGHLLALLKKTKNSRIVATSSVAHRFGDIDFEDINWEKRKYKTNKAYGDSKIANLYFMYEFARRYKHDVDAPIIAAGHPGWTRTELQRHTGLVRSLNAVFSQEPKHGILPSLRAGVDSEVKSGDYFGPSRFFEMQGAPIKVKTKKLAQDETAAKKLWDLSVEMTGVKY
jgi:NAD(P)-dependent dehydrogenase (short-subunit alcohol dehydrogenase family)